VLDNPNSNLSAFGHGNGDGSDPLVALRAAFTVEGVPFGTEPLNLFRRAAGYLLRGSDNANVINMSFDTQTASTELANALAYATQLGVISAASQE